MTQYLKEVVTSVVVVSVITTILPKDGFSKYVSLIASLLVMAIVITPVFNISSEIIEPDIETLQIENADYVSLEFKKNLAEKIKTELSSKTNKEFLVEVDATYEEIMSIRIFPYNQEYSKIVAEYAGIGEDKVKEK